MTLSWDRQTKFISYRTPLWPISTYFITQHFLVSNFWWGWSLLKKRSQAARTLPKPTSSLPNQVIYTMWKVIWIELKQIPFLNFLKCSQYVQFFLVAYPQDVVRVKPPHTLEAYITTASKALKRPMFLCCWCWRILPSYHSVALLSASL